jgi:hypothetical protein
MIYITAIRVSRPPAHERIESVRWENPQTGATGQNTVAQMVEWIRDKNGQAKVQDGQTDVDVAVVDANPPHLRTHANGKWADNLLSLPRF